MPLPYHALDFNEATFEAQKIHADAKAVLHNGKWVFVVITDYMEKLDFPAELKHTPAYSVYQKTETNGNNSLYDWAEVNEYEGLPLLLLIQVYNLEANYENLVHLIHEQLLIKAGVPLTKEEILKSDDSIFNASTWLECLNQAHLEAKTQIEASIDEIYEIA